jgi:hypothetical protein
LDVLDRIITKEDEIETQVGDIASDVDSPINIESLADVGHSITENSDHGTDVSDHLEDHSETVSQEGGADEAPVSSPLEEDHDEVEAEEDEDEN